MSATSPSTSPTHTPAPHCADVEIVKRGAPGYPSLLADSPGAPKTFYVRGGRARLARLLAGPTVAIVGSERPSDYGMEIAASLARGLAAARVTVLGAFANGIAAAAHAGALELDGPTVTAMAGGVEQVQPASRRALYERVIASGCAIAIPPCGAPRRRWHAIARARMVAALATLTVVVEADQTPWDLVIARAAQTLGRPLAAIPGRVTSPVSRGTNALIAKGAHLIQTPADVLDLLHGLAPTADAPAPLPTRLPAHLRVTLERVGAGADTPGKLTHPDEEDPGAILLALAELELMGLLARGDGGRYVPRQSIAGG